MSKKEKIEDIKKENTVENEQTNSDTKPQNNADEQLKNEKEKKDSENNSTSEENNSEEKTPEVKEEISFEEKYNQMNDKYMRLAAEFDNYRKRTLKERMELIKSAGEDILINFLPVVDNLERAKTSIDNAKEIEPIKEGVDLIYKNILDFISQRGIKEIKATGEEFDTDLHEALTKIPVKTKKEKGKVVDVIEKGYKLYDKVIRFAKVVVGD